ncbi:MAG: lysophospholipid acyltransferase family protein [Candidatus Omnitrophota bacterium]|nr:MAG: lysophospholipid acyltransferase family protein [Candidatus Omnitrophota bacterium]
MSKEKKKYFRRMMGWIALRTFTLINGVLPLKWSYTLGKTLGTIAHLVMIRHRRIALESVSFAFETLSLKERKKIASNFFIFMMQSFLEMLHFLRNPRKLENVRMEGREYLESALQKKKGIIILTAHLGNFPLMSLKLAKIGYVVNFVTRPMRDKKTGDYLHTLRTDAGVKTIFSYPRRECVNGIIKGLRSNELVVIQMDQNFGTGGVWVKFFGKLAATPVGPIVFALRTGAAVVPAYIYREAEGRHCIKIFPQEELIFSQDKDEAVLLNAIKFTRIIENWIRKTPSQWGWVHRRWKSRPSDKVRQLKFKIEGQIPPHPPTTENNFVASG